MTMTMSDTPRTDAAWMASPYSTGLGQIVRADFARHAARDNLKELP